jgi:tetratricopeptide (TPR) repeat protein
MRYAALLTLSVVALGAAPAKPAAKPGFAAALEAFKKDASDANRAAVIKAAAGLKTRPALPEGVERFEGRAEYAFKEAKSAADFALAAAEYQKAADAAPWHAPYYFNLGVAQEKAGRLADAKRSFELYLSSDPSAADAKEVRKRVAGLELGIERASSPEGRQAALLEKAEGARFVSRVRGVMGASWDDVLEVKGGRLVHTLHIIELGSLNEVSGFSAPGVHERGSYAAKDGVYEMSLRPPHSRRCRLREDAKALLCETRNPGMPVQTDETPRE